VRRNPALFVFAGAALLLGVVVWFPGLPDAFFLYDDFAHFDLCQRHGLADFFREPMVGTFRPAGFVSLWAEFRLFGWEHPAGYLAVSALLYLINAVLLWRVLHAFGETTLVSGLAATYYLVFPATIELRVWAAGRWDLLCATGVLVSLLAWTRVSRHGNGRAQRSALALGALLAFFGALLAKEHAVGLLVLLPALAMGRRDRQRYKTRATVAWALATSAGVVLVFLFARSRVMPLASTHYGDIAGLFERAPLFGNLQAYATGFVTPPYLEDPSFASSLVRVSGLLGLAGIVLGIRTAGAVAGSAFLLTSGAFLALVIWVPFVPGAAFGGRYLHMPSIPAAILFGIGAASLLESGGAPRGVRVARVGGTLLVGGFVLGAVASGASSSRRWRDAALLSRSVLLQVEQRTDAPALFLRNVPWGFRNGPPVTPCYAFPIYLGRHGARVPLFRCEGVVVEQGWKSTLEWERRRPDVYSQYASPREDEIPVELDLRLPSDGRR
jgi:hypothetical protein